MSIDMMRRVWDSRLPSHSSKLVLLAFADNANKDGICWPSIRDVARRSQLSERQVQRVVGNLKRLGLVEVLEQASRHRTPLYQVRGDKLTPLEVRGDIHDISGVTSDAVRGDTSDVSGVTPTSPKPSGESSAKNHQGEPAAAADIDPRLKALFAAHQNVMGGLNGTITKVLRGWAERLPEGEPGQEAIDYAFQEAARENHRTWRYVEAILERLEGEGWPAQPRVRPNGRQAETDWLRERYEMGQGRRG